MNAEFYQSQVEKLLTMVEQGKGDEFDQTTILHAGDFLDTGKLEAEKSMFRRLPLLVAHTSEIGNTGDFIVREFDSRSWLIVRGDDGVARAFLNYCQHRGTKLVQESEGCKKRFSCPYHAWTYGVKGNLVGVPRADLFPGLDKSTKNLKAGHLEEAFGFLWLTQEGAAKPIAEYLGAPLVEELEEQNFANYHVFFDKTRPLNANWKFPIFAFLESYHIGTLHKNSIAEFFEENIAHSERHGPHIRSFVPRKNLHELKGANLSQINLSEYITPTNILFPNVCMIGHPTSHTIISMFPGKTPGTAEWRHMLLVPKLPETDAEQAHFDKTVAVLDGITYEKEDFWVSEQLQEGINAGAIDELVLATNENMLKTFQDTVEEYSAI
jgi:nitrite reductase/ring-hydroxylating ferredoxin subunit